MSNDEERAKKDELREKRESGEITPGEWDEHFGRERAIFNDTDRKFIEGVETYEESSSRASVLSRRRKKIRQRTVGAMADLSYLPGLENQTRSRIAEELDEGPGVRYAKLQSGLSSLIAFAYLEVDNPKEWLENAIRLGVEEAEAELNKNDRYSAYVNSVEIDLSGGLDLDELEGQFEANSRFLTEAEIGALARSGRLDGDDLEKLHGESSTPLGGLIVER